jgi:4'-phosphopantetheinyl transferase
MCPADCDTPIKVAELLRDDEIHVWHLGYQRSLGRAPLRELLAAYLHKPPQALSFVNGQYGRPALAAPDNHTVLGFNWSHSGDHALIAIGPGIVPGIDLEQLRERPRALQLARRYFSPQEAAALALLSEDKRSKAFLQIWTAKEAVLKAMGRGLAFGLHRLGFSRIEGQLRLSHLDGDDAAAWQLHQLDIHPALVATLAWRGPPRSIRLYSLAVARR